MLADILPPPAPPQHMLIGVAVACSLAGALLLLWARSLGTMLLVMIVAGVAATVSLLAVPHIAYTKVWLVGLAAAGVGGFIAFVCARLIWTLALGALLAAAALGTLGWLSAPAMADLPAWQNDQPATLGGWCVLLTDYLFRWLRRLWQHNATAFALAGGVPLLAVAAVGVFLPKVTEIITSSLLAAAGLVGGAGLFVWAGRPEWLSAWVRHIRVPVMAAGLLALIGAGIQARTELGRAAAARPRKTNREAGQAGEPALKPALSKSDGHRGR